jgi:hypothetical protein
MQFLRYDRLAGGGRLDTKADTSLTRLVTSRHVTGFWPRRLASIAEPPAPPDDARNGQAERTVQRTAARLQAQSDLKLHHASTDASTKFLVAQILTLKQVIIPVVAVGRLQCTTLHAVRAPADDMHTAVGSLDI